MTHSEILKLFPTLAELAVNIDEKIKTVRSWHQRNSIPKDKFVKIVEYGNELDLGITYKMLATAETGV